MAGISHSRNARDLRRGIDRRISATTASTDPPKASRPDSKPLLRQKPDAKDDLKSLPMAEVEKKLGFSPDGLTKTEAAKRAVQYGPNEIEENSSTSPEIPVRSLGSDPVDDRGGSHSFGDR